MEIKIVINHKKAYKKFLSSWIKIKRVLKRELNNFLIYLQSKWWQALILLAVFLALNFVIGFVLAFFACYIFVGLSQRLDYRINFALVIFGLFLEMIFSMFGLKKTGDFVAIWIFFFIFSGLLLFLQDSLREKNLQMIKKVNILTKRKK